MCVPFFFVFVCVLWALLPEIKAWLIDWLIFNRKSRSQYILGLTAHDIVRRVAINAKSVTIIHWCNFGIKSRLKQKWFDDPCIPFASGKQAADLSRFNFFRIESLKNKYQIESRFFVSNLYTSNRILKRAEIAIWIAIGICASMTKVWHAQLHMSFVFADSWTISCLVQRWFDYDSPNIRIRVHAT